MTVTVITIGGSRLPAASVRGTSQGHVREEAVGLELMAKTDCKNAFLKSCRVGMQQKWKNVFVLTGSRKACCKASSGDF